MNTDKKPVICFLIDDQSDDRNIFQTALQSLDPSIQLVTADSGAQALEKLITGPEGETPFLPDYIFLDLNMPYMSGKECLIKLREMDRLKNVPVILYSSVQYFEELAEFGVTGFINKQNSVEELKKSLAEVIK